MTGWTQTDQWNVLRPYNPSSRSLPKSLKLLQEIEKVVQQAHELPLMLVGEVLSLFTHPDLVFTRILGQKCSNSDQGNDCSETWTFFRYFVSQTSSVLQFTSSHSSIHRHKIGMVRWYNKSTKSEGKKTICMWGSMRWDEAVR